MACSSSCVLHYCISRANEYWLLSQPGADVHFVFSQTTQRSFNLFKICRGVEAVGGSAAVSNQERLFDQRDDMPQEFRPWEVSDLTPRVKMDRAQAAHSTQIGRDLYFPFFGIHLSLQGIDARCALGKSIGRAIPQHRSGAGTTGAKAQYRGGDTSSLVHSAVVSQSAAAGKQRGSGLQCAAASTGSWVHMSRGDQTSPTKLVQGVAKATADPFDCEWLSVSTLDSGLFGVYTISQAAAAGDVSIRQAALAQVKAVADGGVTALRGQFLMSLETSEGFLEALATQALTDGTYISPRKSPRTLTIGNLIKTTLA
uniref:Ubiquinol-cytochrome c reductase core protein 2b n=1 Tax=Seriola dumerili TaxID=41447 RepID=A0A3B4TJJ4_SERDU